MADDYDYGDYYDDGMDQEEQADDVIELENQFFEAEEKARESPEQALQLFEQIIEKEESDYSPDKRLQSFQSLKHCILIGCRLPVPVPMSKVEEQLTKMLGLFQYQSRNDGNDVLNQILEGLLRINTPGVVQVFDRFIDSLRQLKLTQLYLNANIKLARVYVERRDPDNLQIALKNIEEQVVQISDPDRKNNLMIELFAYQISYYNIKGDYDSIKPIYRKLERLNKNVHDPKVSAIINETVGKMNLKERRWEMARKSLMESFYNYQDLGDQQAKQVLRYAVLASILENYQLSLFDDMRSRIYENDDGIKVMKKIRQAYDDKDITAFNKYKKDLSDDEFMTGFLGEIHKTISFSKIRALTGCYTVLRIDYVAKVLETSNEQALKYLLELILTRQIKASIHQSKGFIQMDSQPDQRLGDLKKLVK